MTGSVFTMPHALDEVEPMVRTLKMAVQDRLEKDAALRFEICVIEALTNHVAHRPLGQAGQSVTIMLRPQTGGVTVDILDPLGAPAFDPRDHAQALDAVDPQQEGGRGLGLILACADRVEYRAVEGRYRLSLGFDDAR